MSEEVMLCADSQPQGNGSGTLVYSVAALVAMKVPVIVEDNIIEKRASVDLTIENDDLRKNNVFEMGCEVQAIDIGKHNVFGANCFVGPKVVMTEGCVIGPGCKVVSARKLPEGTVIVGRHQPVDHETSLEFDDFFRLQYETNLLRSIYPTEFHTDLHGSRYCAVFEKDISLKKKLTLVSKDNPDLPGSVSCFLPPIHLEVSCPPDYPSRSCPDFNISSCWLSKDRLDNLAAEMLRLWKKDRFNILVSWCSLLQDPLIFLGIEDQGYYDLNEKYLMNVGNPHTGIDVDNKKCSEVGNSLIGNIAVSFNGQNEKDEVKSYHEVAVTKLHFYLTEYDFRKGSHECIICFSTYHAKENNCVRLPCRHVSCKECLQNMLEFKIVNQKWNEFECPECSFKINKDFVQIHVSEEKFERYTNMMSYVQAQEGELWEGEEPLEGQPQGYELQGEVEEGLLHEGEPKADEVPQYLISDELYALQLIEEDLDAHAKWDGTEDD